VGRRLGPRRQEHRVHERARAPALGVDQPQPVAHEAALGGTVDGALDAALLEQISGAPVDHEPLQGSTGALAVEGARERGQLAAKAPAGERAGQGGWRRAQAGRAGEHGKSSSRMAAARPARTGLSWRRLRTAMRTSAASS
jgi:hypothetical protein